MATTESRFVGVGHVKVEYANDDLKRLATDPNENGGFDEGVVKKYRERIYLIENAPDERDFYALKSLHYEKLKGDREGQRSMRLNKKMRLILEIEERGDQKGVRIVEVSNYH